MGKLLLAILLISSFRSISMTDNTMRSEVADQDGPPPLNYDLRARLVSNIIFWSSIVLTLTVIPIALFYPLFYGC